MRVLKASCNTRAHTQTHTALWNWSDKLTQRVKKKERRNGDRESVCFNSLNAFLLSCRLVSVCTVRGRLPPSHHVSTCSSKYSIATSIATTRGGLSHKYNTRSIRKLLSQLKTLHESVPIYKPNAMPRRNFCCYNYRHMCLFFRQ